MRQLRLAIMAVLLIGGSWLALTLAGRFDPRPVGPLRWETGAQSADVVPGVAWQRWLPERLPPAFTVRLGLETGGELSAETEAGLLLGADGALWGVALSNRGYLTVWEVRDGVTTVTHPWHPWPHIRQDGVQEIRLDLTGDALVVWINRERWHTLARPAALAACGECRVGLWGNVVAESAEIRFTHLQLFAPPD